MRTQNSRLIEQPERTALGGFLGGVGRTTVLALIAIVAMIAMAAGCGTSENGDSYDRSYRPSTTNAQPTATAVTISGSSPTTTTNYEVVMDDADTDYWYSSGSSSSSSQSRRATPVPAQPNTTYERTTAVPGGPVTFDDYVQSGWVWADQDNMSTFSLDTDRTSFALALNWAQSGYEIDPDSVRAEEWINAFNYDYPQPSFEDGFGIVSDVFEHPLDSSFQMVRL